MPKKLSKTETWPTLVQERLTVWGRCIHTQRLRQRITIKDLSTRVGISRTTLLRLEKGDPGAGAGAGAYLTALLALGIADYATPALPAELWQTSYGQRVKLSRQERGEDEEYF